MNFIFISTVVDKTIKHISNFLDTGHKIYSSLVYLNITEYTKILVKIQDSITTENVKRPTQLTVN